MTDKTEEDRQRLILEASRAVDGYHDWAASQEPDWDPLHDAVPIEHCNGFMWMYRVVWMDEVVEVYKHGITRQSIHLDHSGRAYLYRYRLGRDRFEELPVDDAVDGVFRDIEKMGYSRETPYDEAYRLEHYRKAREMGWTIVS